MTLLVVLESLVEVVVVVLLVTQIVYPTVTGGRWFPSFRRKDIHAQHVAAEEELARVLEFQQIAALRDKADRIRHTPPQKEDKD